LLKTLREIKSDNYMDSEIMIELYSI
jgi:hypothetical protein